MPTQVLITGAGPVGLAMAAELTRFGLSVRIVDKSPARTDKSKALVVWPRTLELLDRSGAGAKLVSAGRTCTAANLMSRQKTLANIELSEVASPHPYALMIPQSETERVLEEHLGTLGVQVERSTELLRFTETGDSVSCTLKHAEGAEETVEAAWLLACDGAHSTVRHQLNLAFDGDTLPQDWMLADLQLTGLEHPDQMHICLHHDGVLAIFPIGGPGTAAQRTRVIANVGVTDAARRRPDPTLAEVQAVLDARGPGGLHAGDPIWLANFTINERRMAGFRHGRVFFAGDAAHIHSPAGGQGMNTGIQDAINLAWKLALVERKLCANADLLLNSYSAERVPVAEDVLRQTGKLTSLATMESAPLLAVRNSAVSLVLGFSGARHAMAEKLTELDIEYADSPLNAAGSHSLGHPKAGERCPRNVGDPPFGAGDVPRFALFAENGADAEQFLRCFPTVLEAAPRPPLARGSVTLVRPDGYVAFHGDTADYAKADAYMTQLVYGPLDTGNAIP